MVRKEKTFELVYLDSISMYFDERSGCFYGSLRDGRQELTLPDLTIKDILSEVNNARNYFDGISDEDADCINEYIARTW